MSAELSKAQHSHIAQWMQQVPGGLRCPSCQSSEYEPLALVVCLPVDVAARQIVNDGPMDTLLPLRCRRCHFVAFFDADALGLLADELLPPPDEPPEDEPEDEAGELADGEGLDQPKRPRLYLI